MEEKAPKAQRPADKPPAPPPEPGDAELIAEVLAGRAEAFRTLIERHQDPVYDLCYRMMGNAQDAEDVAQDAFLLLYRHLSDYKPGHKVSNWVYTIALNRCRRQLRRRKLVRFFSFGLAGGAEGDEAEREFAAPEQPVDAPLEQEDRERVASRILEALPESLRGPFVLRYFKRMRYQDIASAMHLSLANVKVRLHRAKLLLLKRFGKNVEDLL